MFTILLGAATSADPSYAGVNPPAVTVTNFDNDTANVFGKARKRLFTTESSGSATYRVRLTIAPTATVTGTLSSTDTTEGQVSPQTLVFTLGKFGHQTVTIIGIDDALLDGDQVYTILMAPCTSADAGHNGIDPSDDQPRQRVTATGSSRRRRTDRSS